MIGTVKSHLRHELNLMRDLDNMRVSVFKNDIGYKSDACFYQPYLYGRKIENCVIAEDGINGYVICYNNNETLDNYIAYGNVKIMRGLDNDTRSTECKNN